MTIGWLVAHDYVKFIGNSGLETIDNSVKLHTVNTCANYIPLRHMVSIPIRDMVKLVLPYLDRHQFCQPEHIATKYLIKGEPIHFWENGMHMIAVRDDGDKEPTVLPYEVYIKIQNKEL